MAKPRKRAYLDTGASLQANWLFRFRLRSGTYGYPLDDGPHQAEVRITLHLDHGPLYWMRLQFPSFDQTIGLTKAPRHFGGHQWYFLCPMTGDRASVLWMPRGQNVFASQKYWKGRGLAYYSQFLSPSDRAERGVRRIEARLVYSEADNMIYKSKWMRWKTFHRACQKLDTYEEVIERRMARIAARLMSMARR